MSGFLLDTNCVSELVRVKPSPRVVEWIGATDEKLLHLSVLTFGGGSARALQFYLPAANVMSLKDGWRWSCPPDLRTACCRLLQELELWGAMAGQAQLRGITLPIVDGLVAATARHYDLAIVTRNVKDFSVWGIPVINPWEAT